MTNDFSFYHDLVRELKARNIPFRSLVGGARIPAGIGVVITSLDERPGIAFANVVASDDAEDAVERAMLALQSGGRVSKVVVGVDPGERPGVAILADGSLIRTLQVHSPADVSAELERVIETYKDASVIVRIGHGAATARDRIINSLVPLDVRIEIVDETETSATAPVAHRDRAAAHAIALSKGEEVGRYRRVSPTDGEIRDIQRKSRIASGGEVTVGFRLARDVALGRVTLSEAIEKQRKGARSK
ncbi:MAG: hypothetical protein HY556_08220 [Euryarchaeota archaeon]|nr:hypothetical protein [Euryarchaeota archaeon]